MIPEHDLVEMISRVLDPDVWLSFDGKAPETEDMFGRRELSYDRVRVALKAHQEWLYDRGIDVAQQLAVIEEDESLDWAKRRQRSTQP